MHIYNCKLERFNVLALRRLCVKYDGPLDEKKATAGAGLKPIDVADLPIVAVGFLEIISD